MGQFYTEKTENSTTVWLTPRDLLERLGQFDCDPCACDEPRPWNCAGTNYAKDQNGLLQEWHGRVWLNPPYGRESIPFLKKMSRERPRGLALLFARTETAVWQDEIFPTACAILFLRKRIRFCRPDGTQAPRTANAPSCLISWHESELPLFRALESENRGKLILLNQPNCDREE